MLGHPKKEPAPALQPEYAADDPQRDWQRLRRAARSRDLYPSTQALAWLADLPHAVVPRTLAHDYPRIVNRLALCWCDPTLVALVLESLLLDRRGGRQGFPPIVEQELRGLHAEALRRARSDRAGDGGAGAAHLAPES